MKFGSCPPLLEIEGYEAPDRPSPTMYSVCGYLYHPSTTEHPASYSPLTENPTGARGCETPDSAPRRFSHGWIELPKTRRVQRAAVLAAIKAKPCGWPLRGQP